MVGFLVDFILHIETKQKKKTPETKEDEEELVRELKDRSALWERMSKEKEDRIEELEEALRESVRITAEREVALDAESQKKRKIDEKVSRH